MKVVMMRLIAKNTLRREEMTCAKKTFILGAWNGVLHRWLNRNHPHIKDLSPHLARDAGLSDTEVAQYQHHWPSEGTDDPRR